MQITEPLVIASTTYMTIVELFDECSTPFSPEMMITIYHNTSYQARSKLRDYVLFTESLRMALIVS